MKTIILDHTNIGEFYTELPSPTYKVYKVFRNGSRSVTIQTGLSREEAMEIVQSYPDSQESMVVFDKE